MLKVAIVGMGSMGIKYAEMLLKNNLGFRLVASTRVKPERLDLIKTYLTKDFQIYHSEVELLQAFDEKRLELDALVVATPHYNHPVVVSEAIKRGIYVLCDKPLGVYLKDGRKLLELGAENKVAYIFQHRAYSIDKYLIELVKSKCYGDIKRVNYIVTDWYRPNSYYKSNTWRATYKDEGGGTIINQCPHNLDLLCNLFGLPKRVRSFNKYGKYHPIEVEDETFSYLEWENFSGIFIASTGETLGINRLEISFSKALVTVYKDKIEILENEFEEEKYRYLDYEKFKQPVPKFSSVSFVIDKTEAYLSVFKNFYNFICQGASPLASLTDAINCQYLCNAIYLSDFRNTVVSLNKFNTQEELSFEEEFQKEMEKRI